MKKVAVTLTTINVPYVIKDLLKVIEQTKKKLIIDIIIAGDKKTPKAIYKFLSSIKSKTNTKIVYLDLDLQKKYFKKFKKLWSHIPLNTFARRNFADLYAYQKKYDIITRIDDDNYPIGKNFFDYHSKINDTIKAKVIKSNNGWYNICELLTDKNNLKFYPRGFPYAYRWKTNKISHNTKNVKIDLLAGLWFGDPDIDAITRINRPIDVKKYNHKFGKIFLLDKSTNCAINTQNTSYSRELAPAFFVSPFAGRYDDIFSNYFLRRIMDHLNKNVAFGYPIVMQKRNDHNLWNDLDKELIGNIHCEKIIEKLYQIKFKSNNVLECGYELVDFMMKHVDFEKEHFNKILSGFKIWLDTIKSIDKSNY